MDIFAHLEEKLDILDDAGNKTGEAKTYDEVHAEGLLHLCAHIWLVNSKGQVLLQKRSNHVRVFKEHWDTAASGHVLSGQTSLQTAQIETKEELGVNLPPEAFKHVFSLKENYISNNGIHLENAFNDIYLVHSDLVIEEFKTEPDEIKEVRWFDKEELEAWINGKGEPLTPHIKEEYEKLLEYLEN